MRIERLHLVNFRQHENTELSFGFGVTCILGPNGAGKTTLLEAIAWAIYGAEAARGKRETIRRRGAAPRAPVKVELDIVLGPHRYRIVRTLNSAELYQDANPDPIANSLAAVTERLERLLGMKREEFFNTYFTGQKELAVMSAMKPVERAQFLSRVLGYDKLRIAQDRLRETRTTLRARLQGLESALEDPHELEQADTRARERLLGAETAEAAARLSQQRAEKQVAETGPRWATLQQQREQVSSLEADLKLAEHKVIAARGAHGALDRQLVEANEARLKLEGLREQLEPLDQLRVERARLDELAVLHSNRQVAVAQLENTRVQLQQVKARAAGLPPADVLEEARALVETARARKEETATTYQDRHSAWVRDLQDAQTRRESLRDQYKELKDQLDRITAAGPEGVCPTCARPLLKEYENVRDELEGRMQDVLFNGNYLKQRVEQLAAPPAELADLEKQQQVIAREADAVAAELARLQTLAREGPALRQEQARLEKAIAQMEKVTGAAPGEYDPTRHAEIRRQLTRLDPLAVQAAGLRVAAERAGALVTEAVAAEKALSDREAEVKAVQQRLADLGYSESTYNEAKAAFESAERDRRQAEMGIIQAQAERKTAIESVKEVERRREERARREAEARQAARDVALYNELDKAFTDLRNDLNLAMRPDLSEIASEFVRDLTNGRYSEVELDEEYVATLVEAGDPRPVISGGEEDIASLALRLAISKMIADTAGQPLSLLVLDEIFGSLDEQRREAVMNLLRGLGDRFPQVILITHVEAAGRDADRVIHIEYDADRGAARAREAAPAVNDGLAA
jgi:exonuclease SbcC